MKSSSLVRVSKNNAPETLPREIWSHWAEEKGDIRKENHPLWECDSVFSVIPVILWFCDFCDSVIPVISVISMIPVFSVILWFLCLLFKQSTVRSSVCQGGWGSIPCFNSSSFPSLTSVSVGSWDGRNIQGEVEVLLSESLSVVFIIICQSWRSCCYHTGVGRPWVWFALGVIVIFRIYPHAAVMLHPLLFIWTNNGGIVLN